MTVTLFAGFITTVAALVMHRVADIELCFLPLPVWVLSVLLFLVIGKSIQKKNDGLK